MTGPPPSRLRFGTGLRNRDGEKEASIETVTLGAQALDGRHPVSLRGQVRSERCSLFSHSHWNAAFSADSGPSRGGPCRPAIRPIEASKAGVRYVPLNVDSGRPLRANSGHSPTAWRTGQIDPRCRSWCSPGTEGMRQERALEDDVRRRRNLLLGRVLIKRLPVDVRSGPNSAARSLGSCRSDRGRRDRPTWGGSGLCKRPNETRR
jgi:hypothetical protein